VKRGTILRKAALVAAALLLGGWSWLAVPDRDVAAGNERFAEGDYAGAVAAYRRALAGRADPTAVQFAIGTALTRQADALDDTGERARVLGEAEAALRRAIESRDVGLRAAAYYNLGNALYGAARYEDAAEAYKRALRLDPDRDDARYNLELALRQRTRAAASAPGAGPGQPGGGQGQPGGQPEPDQGGQPKAPPMPGGQGGDEDPSGAPERPEEQAAGEQAAGDEEPDRPAGEAGDEADDGSGTGAGDDASGAAEAGPAPDGADSGAAGEARARRPSGAASEVDRRLDALERMSRDLRRQRLRDTAGGSVDPQRGAAKKDW
jgi:Ca-activated chloride channel homolog